MVAELLMMCATPEARALKDTAEARSSSTCASKTYQCLSVLISVCQCLSMNAHDITEHSLSASYPTCASLRAILAATMTGSYALLNNTKTADMLSRDPSSKQRLSSAQQAALGLVGFFFSLV